MTTTPGRIQSPHFTKVSNGINKKLKSELRGKEKAMFSRRAIGGIAAIAAATAFAVIVPASAQRRGGGPGMMGSGMMGGYGTGPSGAYGMGPGIMWGAFNRPVTSDWGGGVLDYRQVNAYLQQGDQTGTADPKTNTVTYNDKDVTVDLVAVEPGHKDQTFEVHGLVNPTLVVPVGATVHLQLVNMDYGDNMEHGIIVTPVPPPYPYMSMMATGSGVAEVMPLLPWRSEKVEPQAQYASLGATFVAQQPGTYWYVCPTPQHAEEGMYGKFVVE
ncbi:MAG: hypothetical protein P4L90_21360 [Rhodopila sp.]|nr:hypothetical protein [Rhodopila sp.]